MANLNGFFARHAKSSAALVTLAVHAVIIVAAFSFVAVTIIQKNEVDFEAKQVNRPRMNLRKLQVPVSVKKPVRQPRLRKTIVAKPNVNKIASDLKMPEIVGVRGGLGGSGGSFGAAAGLGFSMPELDFFGTKAKGEKIVFVVHFGPSTLLAGRRDGKAYYTPFSRMTGLTIRNRLADLIDTLPGYAMFNVIGFFASDAWAMESVLQQATPANKQKVKDWMSSVNPLEGNYTHCFEGKPGTVRRAYRNYPTLVDDLPFYAPKWCYPYKVPPHLETRYAPDAPNGIRHWARGVVWAILEQKADTIFVLTTNYSDGWDPSQPRKMAKALETICGDTYGPNSKDWPSINVVVLARAGENPETASRVLSSEFGPVLGKFNSEGSIIDDIKQYMNESEQKLYIQYRSEYGNK